MLQSTCYIVMATINSPKIEFYGGFQNYLSFKNATK